MLTITFEEQELYDPNTNSFSKTEPAVFELEHSLVSLSKWESKWQIPFLDKEVKTKDQLLDYIECMVITPNVDTKVLRDAPLAKLNEVDDYINSPQSATVFGAMPDRPGGASEKITAELIYYWMVAFSIPPEYQHWHLNRLFALIRICNIKQQPPKKRSRQEIAQQNREENARRLAAHNTSG